MTMTDAVIYEVRLRFDDGISGPFEAWLDEHVDDMLRFDGFETAETIEAESPDAGSSLRIVRYRVASRAQLQDYLDEHAASMRAEGVARFGDRFSATREIYPVATDLAYAAEHHCLNCEAPLRGQFCAECGQRDKHRIISLYQLLRDLVGDLFELDSRIWRTVVPLLFKPGLLTNEYLRGRYVRYTPPFRLYLVTSLFFFVVAFFGTQTPEFTIDGEDAEVGEVIAEIRRDIEAAKAEAASENPERAAALGEAVAELERSLEEAQAAADSADDAGLSEADSEDAGSDDKCTDIHIGDEEWQNALEARATVVCERLTAEGGAKRFAGDLIDNLPAMMFFFLPVIALVMAFLYPLSRRFYVEHLLFFVHYHSFFFLALTISVLVSRLPAAIPGQEVTSNLLTVVLIFYAPIYLFVGMRRVYEQHFVVTALKFLALGAAYFICLLVAFLIVVLFTALSL